MWLAIDPDELAIEEIDPDLLPNNWQDISAYATLQKIGQDWLTSCKTPILKVLSAIVPVEYNYLFNPEHSDFKVDLEPPIQFKLDRRMWKALSEIEK